jgi:acyl carrier protein
MHNKEDILLKIIEQLKGMAEDDVEINPETNIAEKLALDSVKVLDLLMEIEDDFDVSVPLNLMVDVQTVSDLVDVIFQIESER